MSEPSSPEDMVAELDHWLRVEREVGFTKLGAMVQRARDEIVELRKYWNGKGRAEVLEEAAAIAQRTRTVAGREIANLIRALKTENIGKSEERTSHE